eukprot:2226265-Lingulodinium_polyedra.AAC.1
MGRVCRQGTPRPGGFPGRSASAGRSSPQGPVGQSFAAAQGPGNRQVWTQTRVTKPLVWWGDLVQWYLSIQDSTGCVERALGR